MTNTRAYLSDIEKETGTVYCPVTELRVVRVYEYGSYPWAIVTPDGTPVEVPRVVVRDGQELRFFGAFFPRKRDALVALDDLGRKEGRDCHSLRPLRVL